MNSWPTAWTQPKGTTMFWRQKGPSWFCLLSFLWGSLFLFVKSSFTWSFHDIYLHILNMFDYIFQISIIFAKLVWVLLSHSSFCARPSSKNQPTIEKSLEDDCSWDFPFSWCNVCGQIIFLPSRLLVSRKNRALQWSSVFFCDWLMFTSVESKIPGDFWAPKIGIGGLAGRDPWLNLRKQLLGVFTSLFPESCYTPED